MFYRLKKTTTLLIEPEKYDSKLKDCILAKLREKVEGCVDNNDGLVVFISEVLEVSKVRALKDKIKPVSFHLSEKIVDRAS
jgi:DNA-directed RNA polymerase subunit E'/Rpb7